MKNFQPKTQYSVYDMFVSLALFNLFTEIFDDGRELWHASRAFSILVFCFAVLTALIFSASMIEEKSTGEDKDEDLTKAQV